MNPYILSFLYLVSAITGLLAGSILIFYRRPQFYRYNFLLGLSFIFISLGIFVGFVYLSDLIYSIPHTYRSGTLFIYISFPFSYLYIRNIIRQKGTNYISVLLFLPLIFYLIDFFPFFLSSGREKLEIIHHSKIGLSNTLSYNEGWFTSEWIHLYVRQTFLFFIWLLQLRELLRLSPNGPFQIKNNTWYRWIWMYQIHQTFYWLPSLLFILVGVNSEIRFFTEAIPIVFFFLIHVYLFFNPDILYGRIEKGALPNGNKSLPGSTNVSNPPLPEERLPDILEKLEHAIHDSKAYLNQGYSLHNLAIDIDESPRIVSSVLNTKLNTNFSEYINSFRIEHCITLIDKDMHKTKTIEGLGYECGFSNRTSFIAAFKKYTQETPSKFIKARKVSQKS